MGFAFIAVGGLFLFLGGRMLMGIPIGKEGIARMEGTELVPLTELLARPDRPVWVKGRVACESPLRAELSGTICVHYRTREEESSHSEEGTSWNTIRDESKSVPFEVEDGTGRVRVVPRRPDVYANQVHHSEKFVRDPGARFAGKDRRYREWVIPLGGDVFVFGEAVTDGGSIEIRDSANCPMVVSTRGKAELISELHHGIEALRAFAVVFGLLGLLAVVLGVLNVSRAIP